MGQRMVRVNELLRRELSEQLHTRYRAEAAPITLTEVICAEDLREAKVYYSALGDAGQQREAARLLERAGQDLRQRMGRRVRLRRLPRLVFVYDQGMERGASVLEKIDEIERDDNAS